MFCRSGKKRLVRQASSRSIRPRSNSGISHWIRYIWSCGTTIRFLSTNRKGTKSHEWLTNCRCWRRPHLWRIMVCGQRFRMLENARNMFFVFLRNDKKSSFFLGCKEIRSNKATVSVLPVQSFYLYLSVIFSFQSESQRYWLLRINNAWICCSACIAPGLQTIFCKIEEVSLLNTNEVFLSYCMFIIKCSSSNIEQTIFHSFQITYLFFLLLFSYVLLFNFSPPTSDIPSIHWTEILTIILVTSMLIEEIHCVSTQAKSISVWSFFNYFLLALSTK